MLRQMTVKGTLDKLNLNACRELIMARETIPLLPITHSQTKLVKLREIESLVRKRRIILGLGSRRGQEACHVENTGHFVV